VLLLVILMWAVFAIGAASGIGWGRLSVPQLAAVLSLLSLVVGSTLGVLIQIQLATGAKIFTNDAVGAHATAQVSGYLVLMSVGLIDWRLLGDRSRRTLASSVMIGALFLGGRGRCAGATHRRAVRALDDVAVDQSRRRKERRYSRRYIRRERKIGKPFEHLLAREIIVRAVRKSQPNIREAVQ